MTKEFLNENKNARLFLSHSYPAPQVTMLKAPLALFPGERLVMGFPDAIVMRKFFASLLGESSCSGGTKFIDGADVSSWGPESLARYGIGFGSGRKRIFPALTLEEHIRLRLSILSDAQSTKRVTEEVKASFSALADVGTKICGNFSGGQQQALMLALAMLGSIKLAVIEEAWMGLSARSINEADERFKGLQSQGVSILLLTQETTENIILIKDSNNDPGGAALFSHRRTTRQ
jgi:ABC-type lipopolysaccharide export system ATPase subunit